MHVQLYGSVDQITPVSRWDASILWSPDALWRLSLEGCEDLLQYPEGLGCWARQCICHRQFGDSLEAWSQGPSHTAVLTFYRVLSPWTLLKDSKNVWSSTCYRCRMLLPKSRKFHQKYVFLGERQYEEKQVACP